MVGVESEMSKKWIILIVAVLIIGVIYYKPEIVDAPIGNSIDSLTNKLFKFLDYRNDIPENTTPHNYTYIPKKTTEPISIACWNLQAFGKTKASNDNLLYYYANKLDDYDIFVVQEIRDSSGEAIEKLASKLPTYNYIITKRAGSTSVKEQEALFYNSRVNLTQYTDWTDIKASEFERPPLEARFKADNWTFTIYSLHIDPDNAEREMIYLERMASNNIGDTIVIGDLNADYPYYPEKKNFLDWNWVINDSVDTTVSDIDATYDRIIIDKEAENNLISGGVMTDVISSQSDHYLIYATFNSKVP